MDEGGSGRIRRMMCTRRGLLLLPMPRGKGFPLAMRRLRIRLRMSGICGVSALRKGVKEDIRLEESVGALDEFRCENVQ